MDIKIIVDAKTKNRLRKVVTSFFDAVKATAAIFCFAFFALTFFFLSKCMVLQGDFFRLVFFVFFSMLLLSYVFSISWVKFDK